MVIAICIFLGCFVALAGFLSHRHLQKEYDAAGVERRDA